MTRYKGVAEANPSNYVLLSSGGEFGADKSGGDGRSANGGGGVRRAIADQSKHLKRFILHDKLKAIGTDLVAEKSESNRGRGRGSAPVISPRRLGWKS